MSAKRVALVLVFAAAAALRLHYTTELPVNTGDVVRHLYQGLAVLSDGLSSAAEPLTAISPRLRGVAWAAEPYNYPVLTLFFFTAVAGISPTIFFAKLVLTIVAAANTAIIYRLTREPWLAAAYWAFPASIWWASHEAQFEPLQNFFVFAALLALRRNRNLAFVLLALAVQVKLTAVLLLPVFIWVVATDARRRGTARGETATSDAIETDAAWPDGAGAAERSGTAGGTGVAPRAAAAGAAGGAGTAPRAAAAGTAGGGGAAPRAAAAGAAGGVALKAWLGHAAAFGAGFAPTAVATLFYPAVSQVLSYRLPMVYNPYYWNPLATKVFAWQPPWLIAWNQFSSYGLLVVLAAAAWRLRRPVEFAPSLAFVALCKAVTHAQFWYLVLLPSFMATISARRLRLALFLLLPLLEIRSTVQILFGPFGYTVGGYYRGVSVYQPLTLPPH